jgi:hypothetical protein
MAKAKRKSPQEWKMPAWMEPFRKSICNTAGNDIEEMMNGDADPYINLPLSTLQACVKSQVSLLYALNDRRMLTVPPGEIPSGFGSTLVQTPSRRSRRSPEANG